MYLTINYLCSVLHYVDNVSRRVSYIIKLLGPHFKFKTKTKLVITNTVLDIFLSIPSVHKTS